MKTNYILPFAIAFLFCTGLSAQKIKTKKNIISINDVEAARIEKRENKENKEKKFVYYDLSNGDSVVFQSYTLAPQKIYYGIKTSLTPDTADMKLEMLSFTFSEEKALTELIVKQYKFITAEGLQKETIKEYITNQTEKEIPKFFAEIARNTELDEKVDAMKLAITKDGVITQEGKKIGSINNYASLMPPQTTPIILSDNSGKEIARIIDVSKFGNETTIQTYDKKKFLFVTQRSFAMESYRTEYLSDIVHLLARKEYLPGQSNSPEAVEKQNQAALAEAQTDDVKILKSKTIVYGELAMKDNTTQIGFFKCQFRQTDEGNINEYKDFVPANPTNYSVIDKDNYDGKQITFYPKGDGKFARDRSELNDVDFNEGIIIPLKDCKIFSITATYDKDGKMSTTSENYAPIEFTAKYNGKSLGFIPSKYDRFALLLTNKNYTALYRFRNIYILSIEWANKKTLARDYFTQKELLDFAKDYPAMVDKINGENNYLDGEKGLIQFTKDFDQVIMKSH